MKSIRYIIYIYLIVLVSSDLKAQIGYGLHLGVNSGKYFTRPNQFFDQYTEYGIGFNFGGVVSYSKGRQRLELRPGVNVIVSPWTDEWLQFMNTSEKETFIFLEFPLVYSIELIKRLRIAVGITNSIKWHASYELTSEADQKLYLFGLLGELSFSMTQNIELALTYRHVGLMQSDPHRFYLSYSLQARYNF